MPTLTEQDICAPFVGRAVCMEGIARCARKNRVTEEAIEFIVYSCGFLYDRELRELFGITDKLKDLWERRGTEFNVYLYISDNVLTKVHILKYSESGGARPSMVTPKCTQQELRIAKRILEYITK